MIGRSVAAFLAGDDFELEAELARDAVQHFRVNEAAQLRAWTVTLRSLRVALAGWDAATRWRLVLEFPIRRLGSRFDAVLVTSRAVLVLEFKVNADRASADALRQVESYALDLFEFHAATRNRVVVPILVSTAAAPRRQAMPLPVGVTRPVLEASAATLGPLLREVWAALPDPPVAIDPPGWETASYRPVPSIVDAARTLYARNSVADIAAAGAEARNLGETTAAILTACRTAREARQHVILFVTGTPGAGKTLCGLNVVFGADRQDHATFLTGNPTLVHVLREALVRDAVEGGLGREPAKRRMKGAIQALPAFRDDNLPRQDPPSDRIAVIDEAQRAWSRAHAIRKSVDRTVRLSESEPWHLLDIMGRHADWAAIVCLIGNGQEIHTGEGGLAEWGTALVAHPKWRIIAPPQVMHDPITRQRLPPLPGLALDAVLHLDIPVRSIRNSSAAAWADAVVAGDAAMAMAIAQRAGGVPFRLTRELDDLRAALRQDGRGDRRCGLIGSSGAKRLRADALGVELAHTDDAAVAHWFLDRWPEDVRASDALEVMATEFACQGLELDFVGLCWGGDLVRAGGRWLVRDFRGTKWQIANGAERQENRLNTYRVLLTRARYATVIWVPRGHAGDRTRRPGELDAVAAFLGSCGVLELELERPGEDIPAGPQAERLLL